MKITFECDKDILEYLVEHKLSNEKYDNLTKKLKSYSLENELRDVLYQKAMEDKSVIKLSKKIKEICEYIRQKEQLNRKANRLVKKYKLEKYDKYEVIAHNIISKYVSDMIIDNIAKELKKN